MTLLYYSHVMFYCNFGPCYVSRRQSQQQKAWPPSIEPISPIQTNSITPNSSNPTRESGGSMGCTRTPRCSPDSNQPTDFLLTHTIHMKIAQESKTLSSKFCE